MSLLPSLFQLIIYWGPCFSEGGSLAGGVGGQPCYYPGVGADTPVLDEAQL